MEVFIAKWFYSYKFLIASAILAIAGFVIVKSVLETSGGGAPGAKVVLGAQDNIFSALPILALQKGFFEKRGVELELRTYASGKLALEAAQNGQADLSVAATAAFIIESFERDDLRVLTALGFTDSATKIVARKDLGISSPEDLGGKVVGVQKNSATHVFLDVFLAAYRISPREVKFYEPEELVPALAAGEIQAFAMRSPYIQQARQKLGSSAAVFEGNELYRQYMGLATTQKWLKDNPETAKKVLAALLDAQNFIARHPAKAKSSLVDFFGPRRFKEISQDWEDYDFGVYLGEGFLLSLESEANWYLSKGAGESAQPPDYLNLIASEYLKSVSPASVILRE